MPHSWQKARDSYRYPVRLADFDFKGHRTDRSWFEYDTGNGDRFRTMEFEDRFRKLAPHHLEAWYEVVFWKLSSQGGRANIHTPTAITNIEKSRLTANDLWDLCGDYMGKPNSRSFKDFRKYLFPSNAVATAATFPAFICPEKFPMVDGQIAKWAKENSHKHIYKLRHGSVMLPTSSSVNSINQFVIPWYQWCRHTADILSDRTGEHWRARDVEMAVFTVQRSQRYSERPLTLNPLT